MKQNGKRVIVRLCTALLCAVMFSLSVSASESLDTEESFEMMQEVYTILSGPMGNPYHSDMYFDGSEIQLYKEADYYLIGLKGTRFYTYLLYDKQDETLIDLGMENEILKGYQKDSIFYDKNKVTFLCSGQKRDHVELVDFPYYISYDITNRTFSKKQALLISPRNKNTYRVGSNSSDSSWKIKHITELTDGFAIYFDRLEQKNMAVCDFPELQMETEESGKVRIWIKNCTVEAKLLEETQIKEVSQLHSVEYQKGRERGIMLSFAITPGSELYGKIDEIGYPEPIIFTIKN